MANGAGGRPPKPTRVKELEGNPGKRPLPEDEPEPELVTGAIEAPEWLSTFARAEWRRVQPVLADVGLLTTADLSALEAYCQSWGVFREAEREIKANGVLVPGRLGETVKNPAVQIARDALAACKTFMVEFGMTPSSRGRMHVTPKAEQPDDTQAVVLELLGGGSTPR